MAIAQHEKIKEYIIDKKVLDVGVVDHSYEKKETITWTHQFIVDHAEEVVGIDILEEEIEKLQNDGYNVYVSDAQNFEFDEKFDVIFAGELIEHLSNPGEFLNSAKSHLRSDGKIVLTTPNALSLKYSILNMKPGGVVPNKEHTTWFCQHTLSTLLSRYGFGVERIDFYELHSSRTDVSVLINLWLMIVSLFPKRFYNQLLFVAELSD